MMKRNETGHAEKIFFRNYSCHKHGSVEHLKDVEVPSCRPECLKGPTDEDYEDLFGPNEESGHYGLRQA